MTLVVLPDGGQQPSASGHQCRNGANRMANATASSKPEMYSRGVQTGFPHSHASGNLQHLDPIPICICGQAAEGNCWCESLGILKELEACKLVLQKGCRRSRVAILLSIHEEFCRSARGDAIINTGRRGSAHGDIRVRRTKAVPPPTLPRPRAQSLIVRNSRGAINKANETKQNISGNVCAQRSQAECVRPKETGRPVIKQSFNKPSKPRGLDVPAKTVSKHLAGNVEKCLDEKFVKQTTNSDKPTPKPNTESCVDQSSYVSKARLLFQGSSVSAKTKRSDQKHFQVGKEAAACANQRVAGNTDHVKEGSSKCKVVNDVSNMPGQDMLRNTSASKSDCMVKSGASQQMEEAPAVAYVTQNNTSVLGEISSSPERSLKRKYSGHSCAKRRSVDVGLKTTEKCASQGDKVRGADSENVPSLDVHGDALSASFAQSATTTSENQKATLSVPADMDIVSKEVTMKTEGATAKSNRLSCRDSGIGDDVSLSEVRLCNSQDMIVEDQAEESHQPCQSEHVVVPDQRVSILAESFQERESIEAECNTLPKLGNDLPAKQSVTPDVLKERRVSDATLQTDDEPLLGACAMFEITEDSSTLLASGEPEVTVSAIETPFPCENLCAHAAAGTSDSERKQSTAPSQHSFMSSTFFVPKLDTRFKSEHCVYVLDKSCKQVYLSGANIHLSTDQKYMSSLDVALPSELHKQKQEFEQEQLDQEHFDLELKLDHKQNLEQEQNLDQELNLDQEQQFDQEQKLDQEQQLEEEPKLYDENVGEDGVAVEQNHRKKENRRSRELKPRRPLNPLKVGTLRYLISQSPLLLCEPSDSDYDESDSESDEPYLGNNENIFAVMPVEIVARIFKYLNTRDLANLKCACKNFQWLIDTFDIKGRDSKWVESDQYRKDPCMQCGKIRDPWGDVSLCCWHPKIYYRNGHYGRRYWTCCFNPEEDAIGCEVGLHDNNWLTAKVTMRRVPKPWSSRMWHICSRKDICWPDC